MFHPDDFEVKHYSIQIFKLRNRQSQVGADRQIDTNRHVPDVNSFDILCIIMVVIYTV